MIDIFDFIEVQEEQQIVESNIKDNIFQLQQENSELKEKLKIAKEALEDLKQFLMRNCYGFRVEFINETLKKTG